MTEEIGRAGTQPFTHTAYLFVRNGMRKGRVFRLLERRRPVQGWDEEGGHFAFIDMLPRGGWDGRIRFVKIGDPPPGNEPSESGAGGSF